MAEHTEPHGFVKMQVKDLFIEAFRQNFDSNHPVYPDLVITGQFPYTKIEFQGVVVSWADCYLHPSNIGDDYLYWFDIRVGEPMGEGSDLEQYRSDGYLFDGKLNINVGARTTNERDAICDEITKVLMWSRPLRSFLHGHGVEFEIVHTWAGDNETSMPDESQDIIHTETMTIQVSGECWVRRDPVRNVVESVGLVVYDIRQDDPMPDGYWYPPQGLS